MLKLRKLKGFTLVELLVVVVIIGILAAIALPNFIGAQAKAKNASVKGNMRTIQIASESYATDSGGAYSTSTSGALLNYLPGGCNSLSGTTTGVVPNNPMTGTTSTLNAIAITNVQVARATSAASAGPGGTGNLGYGAVSGNTSYAVEGSDTNGNLISNGTGTLVLSNQ